MKYLTAIWNFLDGKKRTIAAIGGVLLAWAMKYHVVSERWLDLGMGLDSALAGLGIGHAIVKDQSDAPPNPPAQAAG